MKSMVVSSSSTNQMGCADNNDNDPGLLG